MRFPHVRGRCSGLFCVGLKNREVDLAKGAELASDLLEQSKKCEFLDARNIPLTMPGDFLKFAQRVGCESWI